MAAAKKKAASTEVPDGFLLLTDCSSDVELRTRDAERGGDLIFALRASASDTGYWGR
ncbi:hypothetical protein [Burkholderia ambifaria]|uniref:hypothetical protein n=1 Tax=Burkholderia ambifaria TaxID=152480 RepID=UPI0015890F7F|nr:hypothetical protein [Burkholderia ambifaria]